MKLDDSLEKEVTVKLGDLFDIIERAYSLGWRHREWPLEDKQPADVNNRFVVAHKTWACERVKLDGETLQPPHKEPTKSVWNIRDKCEIWTDRERKL